MCIQKYICDHLFFFLWKKKRNEKIFWTKFLWPHNLLSTTVLCMVPHDCSLFCTQYLPSLEACRAIIQYQFKNCKLVITSLFSHNFFIETKLGGDACVQTIKICWHTSPSSEMYIFFHLEIFHPSRFEPNQNKKSFHETRFIELIFSRYWQPPRLLLGCVCVHEKCSDLLHTPHTHGCRDDG